MIQRTIKRYGWKRDLPDHRDLLYGAVHHATAVVEPPSVNLKPKLALVFDQGDLGSCTANSTMWMWQFVHGAPPGDTCWSRMFTYIESLIAEGSYPQDAGAELRDVIKVMSVKGIPPEKDFPYIVSTFPHKPSRHAIQDAANDKVISYSRLATRADFLNCLASGFPFVFGFTVYESFESQAVASTGIVPMPKPTDQVLGGHAVCCIGYDQNFNGTGQLYYLVQNSWGLDWGVKADPGCFWMPATYLENPNLASDYWTVRNSK